MEVDGLAIVAHEMKAPLSLMRQLALGLPYVPDEAERGRVCEDLVAVSERAIAQVNDLTRMAQLEHERFPLEPVAVRAVCDEVGAELEELFARNGRKLETKYSNRSRLVVANWVLLKSVVQNFCLNAMQYAAEESASVMTVRERRGRMLIEVRDYGPALPLKVWREMQGGGVEQPLKVAMRPGSSGLGLMLASRFAKFMGAEVGAVRHRDGASFFVELKLSRQGAMFE